MTENFEIHEEPPEIRHWIEGSRFRSSDLSRIVTRRLLHLSQTMASSRRALFERY